MRGSASPDQCNAALRPLSKSIAKRLLPVGFVEGERNECGLCCMNSRRIIHQSVIKFEYVGRFLIANWST